MEKKRTGYLAVHTTREVSELVSLYAAVYRMKKSTILHELLEKWIKVNKITRDKLIEELAGRIKYEWKVYNAQQCIDKRKVHMSKKEFLEDRRRVYKTLEDNTVLEALKLCGYEAN